MAPGPAALRSGCPSWREEKVMPKATVAGASEADPDGVCRTFEPLDVQHGGEQPPVAEGDYSESGGGASSAGNSSSASTETPDSNSPGSDQPRPQTAPSAEPTSPRESMDGSDAASQTTTSTTGSGTTSRS